VSYRCGLKHGRIIILEIRALRVTDAGPVFKMKKVLHAANAYSLGHPWNRLSRLVCHPASRKRPAPRQKALYPLRGLRERQSRRVEIDMGFLN